MNINKPQDSMTRSLQNEENTMGSSSQMGNDSLSMIRQLANELYREDLAPEIMEHFTTAKTEIHKHESHATYNKKMVTLPDIPGGTKQYSLESLNAINKADFHENFEKIGDSAYYFLPGYQPAKEVNRPFYSQELDIYSIRKDFPILHRRVNGKPLVWLDNGATTQKPVCVMNALSRYYSEYNSNIHRGAHTLAKLATNAYESAREKIQKFIGAPSSEEIIFVRGTTEAINLVAESFGGMNIHKGDEIVLSMMEHHSNIVPWQKLQQVKGAVVKVIPVNDRGEIILDEYEKLLTPRTRIVALTHVSNVLGTVNPVHKMIEMAHSHGAYVLIDGAQSVPHIGVDVKELDADFYAFSGHKVYGPTGIGVLYGKRDLLEEMPPWQRGGGMIKDVSFNETTYNSIPYKFEAGTGNIADAIGLGASIDYIQKIGMDNIERHEKELTLYAMEKLYQVPGLHIIGTAPSKTSVLSFVIDGVSPENAAQFLNQDGIAIRAGHHCAQPVLRRYGLTSSIRASLGVYNTKEEVDSLVHSVLKIAKHY